MGGATLGNIADTKLPIPTVDIGMAQLAMHSCFETMGSRDVEAFVRAVRACYESSLRFTRAGGALRYRGREAHTPHEKTINDRAAQKNSAPPCRLWEILQVFMVKHSCYMDTATE